MQVGGVEALANSAPRAAELPADSEAACAPAPGSACMNASALMAGAAAARQARLLLDADDVTQYLLCAAKGVALNEVPLDMHAWRTNHANTESNVRAACHGCPAAEMGHP